MAYPYKSHSQTPNDKAFPPPPPSHSSRGSVRESVREPRRGVVDEIAGGETHGFRSSRMQAGYPKMPQAGSSRVEPTRSADSTGKAVIVRPGEPHHFGSSQDHARGLYLVTLCRYNNPTSHGDAYTMLDSPHGHDIHGDPIDWQTANIRILDLYGKDQISHEEEVEAIPSIFDARTAAGMLANERNLQASVRAGEEVTISTRYNKTSLHNEDGHAKSSVMDGRLRAKIDRRGGLGQSFRQSRWD